jgi:hypothetical protein
MRLEAKVFHVRWNSRAQLESSKRVTACDIGTTILWNGSVLKGFRPLLLLPLVDKYSNPDKDDS